MTLSSPAHVSTRSIPRWLRKLERCGHIKVHWTPDDRNFRKITLTEGPAEAQKEPAKGMIDAAGGMTGPSKGMTGVSGGMTGRRTEGMTGQRKGSACIRKNIYKTTTTAAENEKGVVGDDEKFNSLKIPEKITSRFSLRKILKTFAANCGWDVGLMERYLAKADAMKINNPVGMAVRMAGDYRRDGPPGSTGPTCALCGSAGLKRFDWNKTQVWLCGNHYVQYRKLKDDGKQEHFTLLSEAARKEMEKNRK